MEKGETVEHAAARELLEESTILALQVHQKGNLIFELDSYPYIMDVHIFEACQWSGTATETDEMKPAWFPLSGIPYDSMWPDDRFWLPRFLRGESFKGKFLFSDDSTIISHDLVVLDPPPWKPMRVSHNFEK